MWVRSTITDLMLQKALARIPAYLFYMQGMVTVTIAVVPIINSRHTQGMVWFPQRCTDI